MSPAWIGRFPWYLRSFGGKQGARSIHFVGLCIFLGFTVVHTIIVIIHDVRGELPAIVFGNYGVRPTLAIIIALVAILGIVAVHVVATDWSRRRPRQVQHTLGYVVDPIQRTLTNLLVSREHYPRNEISPYFGLNGYPPVGEENQRLAADGFRDWRLSVTGIVERPLCLSLDDLRRMERRVQVTKHNCIQGWTAIGEWTGVPLSALLAACGPLPNARYLLCYAYDDKSQTAVPALPLLNGWIGARCVWLIRIHRDGLVPIRQPRPIYRPIIFLTAIAAMPARAALAAGLLSMPLMPPACWPPPVFRAFSFCHSSCARLPHCRMKRLRVWGSSVSQVWPLFGAPPDC